MIYEEPDHADVSPINLIHYTGQGIDRIKGSLTWIDTARQAFRFRGAASKALYFTLGEYDLISLLEAPDDETAMLLMLEICGQGNVRIETLRASREDEFREILDDLARELVTIRRLS